MGREGPEVSVLKCQKYLLKKGMVCTTMIMFILENVNKQKNYYSHTPKEINISAYILNVGLEPGARDDFLELP